MTGIATNKIGRYVPTTYIIIWYGNILFDIVHNILENILTKHKNI